MTAQHLRRFIILFTVVFILIGLLLFRLAYIQLVVA